MYFVALGLSRLSDIKEDLLSKVMSHVLSAGIHMHPFITPYTCDLCAENIYFFVLVEQWSHYLTLHYKLPRGRDKKLH